MKEVDLVNKMAKAIDNLKDAKALVKGVFSPLDEALASSDDSTKNKFIELLNRAEKKVGQMGGEKQGWWMSEIYLRKGRCARGILDKAKEYPFWKQAFEYAMKAKNHEVIIQSCLELGFDFVEFTSSIREILEIQMNCVRAVCAEGTAIHTRLRIIGINLFNFWHQLEYRRLSERDLKAKQLVIDSAKSLEKAGFDEDRAAPVMIILISKVFEFNDPCLEWAHLETGVLDIPVPDDVKKKIGSLQANKRIDGGKF
jgi:hypothetical protein